MKTEKSTIGKIHEILAIFVTFVTSFIILELTHHRFFSFLHDFVDNVCNLYHLL